MSIAYFDACARLVESSKCGAFDLDSESAAIGPFEVLSDFRFFRVLEIAPQLLVKACSGLAQGDLKVA